MAGGATGIAGLAAAGTVAAEHSKPAKVTIEYDEETLDRFKPHLQMHEDDRELFLGLYGWVAKHEDRDLDVAVYWARYRRQRDAFWAPGTDHWGDHEPVQVLHDPETNEAVTIRASIWHWYKGEQRAATVPMDGENPRLRVMNPHHQYSAAEPDASLTSFDVLDLRNAWDDWIRNDLENDVVVGASYEPWVMENEASWWRKEREAFYIETMAGIGFGDQGSLSN